MMFVTCLPVFQFHKGTIKTRLYQMVTETKKISIP